jgi:MFS family permease
MSIIDSRAAVAAAPVRLTERWQFVVGLFTVGGMLEAFGFGHMQAFVPIYLPELGVPADEVARWASYLASAAFVVGLPLSPFWGVWADRFSRKLMIVRSFYGEVGIFLMAAAAPNIWIFLMARALVGFVIGNGGIQFAIVSTSAPRRHMAFAISMVSMGPTLGSAFGPAYGGFFVDRFGVRPLLALDAATMLGVALATTFLFHDQRPARSQKLSVWQLFRRLGGTLRGSPTVLALFGVQFLALAGFQLSRPLVPVLVSAQYQGPDLGRTIGLAITAYGVAFSIFAPLWGRLSERTGYLLIYRLAVLMLSLALAAQTLTANVTQTSLVMALQGVFQAGLTAMFASLLAANTSEEMRSSVMALVFFPNHSSNLLGNGLGSLVVGISVHAAFLVAGLLVFSGFALLMFVSTRRPLAVRAA